MSRLTLALVLFVAFAASAFAHESRPAYLEVREITPETYDVLWKVPARGGDQRLSIHIAFPEDTRTLVEPVGTFADAAYLERSRVRRPGGLEGATVRVDGLEFTQTDALIRITDLDGVTQTTRVTPDNPTFLVEASPSTWTVASTYLVLGFEHILLGIDHLLFVLALMLLVKGWKRLLGTVTAFTVAHSLTLAAATLGFVHVPGPPVEACIALSILFVAAEIVHARAGRMGIAERWPWIVAFLFGLLHGLGFAGALSAVGLPQQAIPIALFFFNVGVELGQIAFIVVVFVFAAVLRRLPIPQPTWGWRVAPYAIGSVAAFWFVERTVGFL